MGKNRIAIEDNFFAHQPHRTLELCNAIADLVQEVPFSWDCQTRLESMKRPDVVAAMARANCEAAYLGIEALDEEHLLYLAKTLRPEDYLRILEEIVIPQMMDVGIDAYINLQLGIPGETNEHRTTTLRRLRRLGQIAKSHGRAVTVFPQLNVIYSTSSNHSPYGNPRKNRFSPILANILPMVWAEFRLAFWTKNF